MLLWARHPAWHLTPDKTKPNNMETVHTGADLNCFEPMTHERDPIVNPTFCGRLLAIKLLFDKV